MKNRRVGIHAGVLVGAWDPTSALDATAAAQAAGYDAIEIPAFDAAALDVEATREALKRYDLTATCSLGLPLSADISSFDATERSAGERYLLDAVAFADAIESDYVGGIIYGGFGKHLEPPRPGALEQSATVLARVACSAAEAGITLGLEVVNRYESNLLNTGAQALAYLEMVGEPNVAIHLDTYHMNIEEIDPGDTVRAVADKLGYVHLGEGNRGPLGEGTVDFVDIANALKIIDYQGTVTFESFSSAVLDSRLSNNLAIWRNTWTDPAQVASVARSFIRKVLW